MKPCRTKIAWPSPEAVGIDIPKTMAKFNYIVNFSDEINVIRIGMILTNDFSEDLGDNYQINSPSLHLNHKKDWRSELEKFSQIIEWNEIELDSKTVRFHDKELYNWKKGILWRFKNKFPKKSQVIMAFKQIHDIIFKSNHYYAISLNDDQFFLELDKNRNNFHLELIE